MQQEYTVFFIPTRLSQRTAFGSTESGVPAMHLYSDDELIEKTKRFMDRPARSEKVNHEQLRKVINDHPYTHVCLNQDWSSIVSVDDFLSSLVSGMN